MTEWKTVKVPAYLMQSVEIVTAGRYMSRGEIVREALRMFLDHRIEHLVTTKNAFPENIKILEKLREYEHNRSDISQSSV